MDTQPSKHVYEHDGIGLIFDTADELATWLLVHPDEIAPYMDSVWRLAQGVIAWNDYRTSRDALNFMLDVLVIVAEKQGKRVLK